MLEALYLTRGKRKLSDAKISFLAVLALFLGGGTSCDNRPSVGANGDLPENFSCAEALPGWKRASAITPDVVPPCMTGSSGSCDGVGSQYVSGTGWCRPR
jgi:hypothetical protein